MYENPAANNKSVSVSLAEREVHDIVCYCHVTVDTHQQSVWEGLAHTSNDEMVHQATIIQVGSQFQDEVVADKENGRYAHDYIADAKPEDELNFTVLSYCRITEHHDQD